MKKVLFAAVIALPVLLACNGKQNATKLETPKQAAAAATIKTSDAHAVITVQNENLSVKQIEFFRSGRYLITAENASAPTPAPTSKGEVDNNVTYINGTYTFTNGSYTLSGGWSGQVVVGQNGTSISIDGTNVSGTITPATVTEGSTEDSIFRTWRFSVFEFELTYPKPAKQKITFSGNNNVTEVLRVLKDDYGINIDDSVFYDKQNKAYNVSEISLNPNTIMVTFTNGATFGGSWNFNISSGGFQYDLTSIMQSNGLFNGSASGKVEVKDGKCVITLTANTDEIKGNVILTMVEAA